MGDFSDFIHEDHHIFLQDFSAGEEVMDEAETEDGIGLLSGDHRVHVSTTGHVLRDDSGASITETKDQQMANLLDGIFQYGSLQVRVKLGLIFLVDECVEASILHLLLCRGRGWVLCNLLNDLKHPLKWMQHKSVGSA